MTARISPRRIVIDTSLRLTTPPKRSVTCSMSKTRSSAWAAEAVMSHPFRDRDGAYLGRGRLVQAVQFGGAPPGRDEAGRTEDHHQKDECADPHLLILRGHLRLEELRQPGQ